jgi:peptidoglycan/xylan/chitin deacetylase (PgdA/CDA1 family)
MGASNGSTKAGIGRGPVRIVYAMVALVVWLLTGGGRLRRRRNVVLCYHGVLADQSPHFERQMRAIKGRTRPVSDLANPSSDRGRPNIIVTFDDAFMNLITNAIPALHTHNIPAMIFAVSDNLGERPRWSMPDDHPERFERTMTAEELQAVNQDELITIGSHSATHPRLDSLERESLDRELRESKSSLETMLGATMTDLALPHGAYNSGVLRAAKGVGYQRIHTLEHDLAPGAEPHVVGRFSASPDLSSLEFRLLIDGAYAWLGSLRRAVRKARGHRGHTPQHENPTKVAA